jgi:hypothetical protein
MRRNDAEPCAPAGDAPWSSELAAALASGKWVEHSRAIYDYDGRCRVLYAAR